VLASCCDLFAQTAARHAHLIDFRASGTTNRISRFRKACGVRFNGLSTSHQAWQRSGNADEQATDRDDLQNAIIAADDAGTVSNEADLTKPRFGTPRA
jgi:hypothetical protein